MKALFILVGLVLFVWGFVVFWPSEPKHTDKTMDDVVAALNSIIKSDLDILELISINTKRIEAIEKRLDAPKIETLPNRRPTPADRTVAE